MADESAKNITQSPGDPETIRAAMAQTRIALSDDIAAIRDLLIPSQPNRRRNMAKAKSSGEKSQSTKSSKASSRKSSSNGGSRASRSKTNPKAKLTTMAGRAMKEAKEVLGDVLSGAAKGAVRGAAVAVSDQAEEASKQADKLAQKGNPASGSNGKAKRSNKAKRK